VDVLERWVSAKAAQDVYGVVLIEEAAGHGLVVDLLATRERRDALCAERTARGGSAT
jgi:hypothetical protein